MQLAVRAISALVLAMAALLLPACTSIWQDAYRPSPLAAGAAALRYPGEHPVIVREAPWERVESALHELEEQEAASDTHVSEWSVEQRQAATTRLLIALQLHDSPENTVLLGHSSFATTDVVRPEDGTLEAMARRMGADYAIWTSRYLGQGTRVVDRPVPIHRSGWGHFYDREDHVWRHRYYSDFDTAWVPIVVEADRFAFIAFFVRRIGGHEPPTLTDP